MTLLGTQRTLINHAPPGSTFLLGRRGKDDEGYLQLSPQKDRQITRLNFKGRGVVTIGDGKVEEPNFEPSEPRSLVVEITSLGQILAARGSVVLAATERSLCLGADDYPVTLQEVRQANRAEIENTSIYGLGIADLWVLDDAERLIPWIPRRRPWNLAHPARSHEDGMHLSRAEKAHFWTRLAEMLSSKHTPGAVQSEVRYAAMRARLKATPRWNREWWLLSAYQLVGFGERILRPLLWHLLVVSLLVVVGMIWNPSNPDLLETWPTLVLSPLSFFRVVGEADLEKIREIFPLVMVLVVQLVGIVLIFFSLLAVRRVTKAE